jgi:hypothetical protein
MLVLVTVLVAAVAATPAALFGLRRVRPLDGRNDGRRRRRTRTKRPFRPRGTRGCIKTGAAATGRRVKMLPARSIVAALIVVVRVRQQVVLAAESRAIAVVGSGRRR